MLMTIDQSVVAFVSVYAPDDYSCSGAETAFCRELFEILRSVPNLL